MLKMDNLKKEQLPGVDNVSVDLLKLKTRDAQRPLVPSDEIRKRRNEPIN